MGGKCSSSNVRHFPDAPGVTMMCGFAEQHQTVRQVLGTFMFLLLVRIPPLQ